MTEIYLNKNVLVNLSDWFVAPDGKNYKCVWGKLKSISKVDELIGFQPNRPNVNWVFEIGTMVVYGCQVKIIILCDNKPDVTKKIKHWTADAANGLKEYETDSSIYISE